MSLTARAGFTVNLEIRQRVPATGANDPAALLVLDFLQLVVALDDECEQDWYQQSQTQDDDAHLR